MEQGEEGKVKRGKTEGAGSAHLMLNFDPAEAWFSLKMNLILASYNISAEEPTNFTRGLDHQDNQIQKPLSVL